MSKLWPSGPTKLPRCGVLRRALETELYYFGRIAPIAEADPLRRSSLATSDSSFGPPARQRLTQREEKPTPRAHITST